MLIPIRCFTCNQVIANRWLRYQAAKQRQRHEADLTDEQIFEQLNLGRVCCRVHFTCHAETISERANVFQARRQAVQLNSNYLGGCSDADDMSDDDG